MINEQLLKKYSIILASGSPRRQQFFKDLGVPFTVDIRSVEEIYDPELKGAEICSYLSELKANPFLETIKENDIVVTSDTIVWHKERALGKPKGYQEAFAMLKLLSNGTHEVITAVSFTTTEGTKTIYDTTKVTFKRLSDNEINHYISNYKPFDKAGAYGIQEWIGFVAITNLEGSYFNVMGMPMHLVYKTLNELIS